MLQKTDENTLITIGKLFRVKKQYGIKDEPTNNALAFIAYADSLPETIYNQVESECGIINNDEVSFLTEFNGTDDEISVMFLKDAIYLNWTTNGENFYAYNEDVKTTVESYNDAVKQILESTSKKNVEEQNQKHKTATNVCYGRFNLSNEELLKINLDTEDFKQELILPYEEISGNHDWKTIQVRKGCYIYRAVIDEKNIELSKYDMSKEIPKKEYLSTFTLPKQAAKELNSIIEQDAKIIK